MSRRWLRPVAFLVLAIFLIASTPGIARAILWRVGCSCFHGEHGCSHADDVSSCDALNLGVGAHCEDDADAEYPDSPHCPLGPGCPNPICWCQVAHALYYVATPVSSVAMFVFVGPSLVEP